MRVDFEPNQGGTTSNSSFVNALQAGAAEGTYATGFVTFTGLPAFLHGPGHSATLPLRRVEDAVGAQALEECTAKERAKASGKASANGGCTLGAITPLTHGARVSLLLLLLLAASPFLWLCADPQLPLQHLRRWPHHSVFRTRSYVLAVVPPRSCRTVTIIVKVLACLCPYSASCSCPAPCDWSRCAWRPGGA